MTLFLQTPPTGLLPHAAIPKPDRTCVYHGDKGWRPVIDPDWLPYRHVAGHETEFIPGFDITACERDARPRDPLEPTIKSMLSERPQDGCFGLWCRHIFKLRAEGGIVHMGIFGLLWHPEPNALLACQAQTLSAPTLEFVARRFNEPHRDLTWHPYASFEDLWAAIPSLGPCPNNAP